MIRILYSVLLVLAVPFIVLRLYLRSRRAPAYRQRIGERFALNLPQVEADNRPLVWVHAVSVGETVAAAPLVEALLSEARVRVLVTTMTPTGSARVRSLFGERVLHCYIPYDIPVLLRRFISQLRPRLLVVMETELWPNLIHVSHAQGLRILLANARLSAKSARGYERFAASSRRMLRAIDRIAAQSEADAQRFIALGAMPGAVTVTGSLKFNVAANHASVQATGLFAHIKASGRPVMVAASTREHEEEKVLDAFHLLADACSEALLILVPRHPERFDTVAALCQARGFALQRRSQSEQLESDTRIVLGDSMGEMPAYYDCASVVFVGGSLVDTGCQNVLEPAAMGLPVLAGPSQYNFAEICRDLEQAGGLITVADATALGQTALALVDDPARAKQMGAAGSALVGRRQQALPAHLDLLRALLD